MESSALACEFDYLMRRLYQNSDNVFKMGNDDDISVKATWDKDLVMWPLPFLLSVIILGSAILVIVVILIWIRSTMSFSGDGDKKGKNVDEEQASSHSPPPPPPIIPPPQPTLPQPPPVESIPLKPKVKGLLERRGSSASLTIDLALPPWHEGATVTPTRECSTDEFLLSCSHQLSRERLRSCLKDISPVHREFWDLPLNHPEHVIVPGSSSKNRYKAVIPNENTRVCLPVDGDISGSLDGYINANYIKGYDGEDKAFIATQGPMTNTVNDLWEMAWSEGSPAIVMITRLWEKGRPKCEPYLPSETGAPTLYGNVIVTIDSCLTKDGYTIRQITMRKNDVYKKITHYWFDSWPDHQTPPNAHSLLSLAKEVELTRFGGALQRSSSAIWLKECPSPVFTFGSLELKDEPHLSVGSSPSKKRTKTFSSSPDNLSTPDCYATPLDEATSAFRFSPSPTGAEGVFCWKFEKLSTNSTSSYDTAQLSDSPLSRSPFKTSSCGSYSPLSTKAWNQSSGESSVWNEEGGGSPVARSPSKLISPRWLQGIGKRGKPLGPVIVHCSAGIGRTGCFIAICIGVKQLLTEGCVDILSIVCKMRYDRGGMVQTAEQYEFIHRALALFEKSLPGE